MLPPEQAYSDGKKVVTLLANCDESVHTYLSTISYGLTYTQLAERLHSFIESSNNRATSSEKNEIIANANCERAKVANARWYRKLYPRVMLYNHSYSYLILINNTYY